jgi:hypothetical protein
MSKHTSTTEVYSIYFGCQKFCDSFENNSTASCLGQKLKDTKEQRDLLENRTPERAVQRSTASEEWRFECKYRSYFVFSTKNLPDCSGRSLCMTIIELLL